jgi:hypothetical protein
MRRSAALTQDTQHRFGALHYAYPPIWSCPITWPPSPLWSAFPTSSAGRDSGDYYEASVALGLAPGRRSRVRLCRTYQRDVGGPLISFNTLAGRRSALRRLCRSPSTPTQSTAPVSAVLPVDGNLHQLEIGLQAIQLSPYHAGPPRCVAPTTGPDHRVSWHALVPFTFRIQVSHPTQEPPSKSFPAEPGIRQSASRRTWCVRSSTGTGRGDRYARCRGERSSGRCLVRAATVGECRSRSPCRREAFPVCAGVVRAWTSLPESLPPTVAASCCRGCSPRSHPRPVGFHSFRTGRGSSIPSCRGRPDWGRSAIPPNESQRVRSYGRLVTGSGGQVSTSPPWTTWSPEKRSCPWPVRRENGIADGMSCPLRREHCFIRALMVLPHATERGRARGRWEEYQCSYSWEMTGRKSITMSS